MKNVIIERLCCRRLANEVYKETPFRETYEKQIELYREAIETSKNIKVSESYLFMLDAGIPIYMD